MFVSNGPVERIRVEVEGIVQGVGFRPFIYRLAARYGISGWVRNTPAGVLLEGEGERSHLSAFLRDISAQAPPLAAISSVHSETISVTGEGGFSILPSSGGENSAQISPDCDVCEDCLRELFDPRDRRYLYPFINCTNCGPRYSIITAIPYDRRFTTMERFAMCADCRAEYEDPANRRFHAQPNACPVCGPRIALLDSSGREVMQGGGGRGHDVLLAAVNLLQRGGVLAVKGIGGYHLAVDACNEEAVANLRRRKQRDEKPFAIMAPDLARIDSFARCSETEQRLLGGPERPIVLLPKREATPIASLVAPDNGYFGVMLPSTPLHHLLLRNNFIALVMTSGNQSDEPIAYRDSEAREQLAGIADLFLAHDREIHVRSDDSIIRVFHGSPLFLRRSRGYVPRGIRLPAEQPSVLAVGGELKATVCLTRNDRAFLSQHIGDLKNSATLRSLEECVAHLEKILEIRPALVAHDLHPDYLSTAYAVDLPDLPRVAVQHHHAHMASCMAENSLEGEAIGVIFDGTGYGLDGTVWGGEFLVGGYREFRRQGHMRLVALPGGDAAVREPYRMALSYLFDAGERDFAALQLSCLGDVSAQERHLLQRMLERGINAPLTSSCGRLFDAVSALLDVRSRITYEGQAAIELEALAESAVTDREYPFSVEEFAGRLILDMRPALVELLKDLALGVPRAIMARCFHNSMAAATAGMCERIRCRNGLNRVVLSGGVFQNKLLVEGTLNRLAELDFQVFTHRLVPPGDGGLALGQAVIAGCMRREAERSTELEMLR
ncbi:carbamoyltransferase HypF [Pelobacter propionicus]|uniref:Carbamoyltransferase n=1 Tax=Pelobacter propionicus (strain DSM 2379 / NBRC 103807 / OttBd1) TaxID=338966 RepID=A1ASQ9_PELPD|nr:(NiFe) hydrogenase maturation protein HypF [Pelobacter propionicus DSM 2379]